MAKMDSKRTAEKSLKDEDEKMEDKDEKATSKMVDDSDKKQGVSTSSRRRSSRAKFNPASPVPPAAKMDIDDEDEAEEQESSTKRESNQQATTKMDTEENLSAPPVADQEKKQGTSATSTPADSNTSVNSRSKKQSEPTGDIVKSEDTLKDSEKEENDDDDDNDEIQHETQDDSEEYQDEEDNDEYDSSETKTARKRRRGKSTESRPTDSPSRVKRVRNKPIDLYKPADFVPREKAANPKGPAAKAKKIASKSRSSSAPPQRTKGDYVTVINGQGMKLKDIPVIRKTVEESDINSQDLYLVHRLLYSYKGRGSNKLFKTHILEYSGYMRKAKKGENEEKVDEENAAHETFMSTKVFKYDVSRLKLYMDFFQIDRTPTEDGPLNKEALVDRLLDFLCAPSLDSMNPQEDSSSEEEEEEDGDKGGEMTNEKKDDAKTKKATEAKKDDTAAPATALVAKKDVADATTKEAKPKTEDAVTVKKADTKAAVSEAPKNKDESAQAPKDTEISTKAQAKEKQVPNKEDSNVKAKEKTKTDPATTKKDGDDDDDGDGDGEDQPADRRTANAQTYQEWCQKAKIEGAFYLVREHDKGDEPSDAAIRQWVQAYVTCFDMSAATAKHAMETASAKFGVNLTDRKDLIREFIVSEI
ncbi:MAG: hypothetical protein SGBAC_012257 [Bacillariaceae sp.]